MRGDIPALAGKTQKVIPIEQGLKLNKPSSNRVQYATQKVIPIEQGLKQKGGKMKEYTLTTDSEGHSNRTRIETYTPLSFPPKSPATQKVIPIEQGLKPGQVWRSTRFSINSEGHSNRTRIETC